MLQQDLLGGILENVAASIFWKDRGSCYLGCNEQFAREAGLSSPPEIAGKTDYGLAWTREQADFYRECDRRVMESGEPMLNIEEAQRQADGRDVVILTNKVPLRDASGRITGLLGIYMDITERKRQEERLEQSLEENRLLTQRCMRLQEEERRQVAHELHDELGQFLAAIQMRASYVLAKAEGEAPDIADAAADIVRASQETLDTIRDLVRRLRPAVLDYLGVEDVFRSTLADWHARCQSIDYSFSVSGDMEILPVEIRVVLYRILQEGLTNISKHAGARHVVIALKREHDRIELEITDDGNGMDMDTRSAGVGIQGMRERARAAGGEIQIQTSPGQGLKVSVALPLVQGA
ncbi:MAG: PAS domain-containing protein [Pseudomonadota bacterium]|nr:PAS domain-containing protein [Pseudomonadota bacterium]